MLKNLNIQLFADGDVDTIDVQPQEPTNQPEPTQQESIEQPTETPQEPTQQQVDNLLELEGIGKVSIEDIKEWRQGYLRQSDYTRKTTELAKTRKEMEDAVILYEYLKANPHVAQKLKETEVAQVKPEIANRFDPTFNRVEQLEAKIAGYELDMEINRLKTKYPDFNEVAVLQEASKRGITDLEFIHKALSASKPQPDLRSQIEAEVRQKLLQELKQNSQDTQTIISTNDIPSVKTYNLSKDEERIAKAFIEQGVFESLDEYVKYRNS